ncbi:hypothetical protein CP532_4751 [Ophiocordyceps camponoti-leonardi (nom. inval.)]|nr:hypothetical protein CP532_4751 [Ophiocordyceps camponoti-leonardi (nom. inval.)]
MAGKEGPDIEILVHVTAPSTTADDVGYRDLARAYASFEPKSRIRLAEGEGEPSSSSSFSVPRLEVEFESSPALSFRSVDDNRASPGLKEKKKKKEEIDNLGVVAEAFAPWLSSSSSSSFCPPPSQIGDSYPLPGKDFCHASPTRVLEHYLSSTRSIGSSPLADAVHIPSSSSSSSSSSPSPSPSDEVIVHVPSSIPDPALGQEDEVTVVDDVRQVIPVTPMMAIAPTVAVAAGGKRKRDSFDDVPWPFDVTHISSSPLSPSSFPDRAESEPPLPLPPPPPSSSLPSAKKPKPTPGKATDPSLNTTTTPNRPTIHPPQATKLEIIPPSPPVGNKPIDPTSLASEKLLKLSHDLSSRYRPTATSRTPDPLDRGYWLVDCSAWPSHARDETWLFLSNYLGAGLAGWAVWCRRSDAPHDSIRLYCWACVAKHTFLLLYLASGRRVKATGARWYDAEGVVAIEVLPSGRHAS